MHDVHHLMKVVLKLYALTQDWISQSTNLRFIGHMYFGRFTIICHFNIRVSFDCQLAELLLAAYLPSLFCLFLLFACQHIGSVHFVCLHKAVRSRACQAPEKFCGVAKWKSETKVSNWHLGFEHLIQIAQSRIVCVLASLERNLK